MKKIIKKYIGQYIELHVTESDIVRGRLNRVEGDSAIFNPHVDCKYPASNNSRPWLAFIEKDLVQRVVENTYRIVQTTEEDMERKIKYLNKRAKKQAEFEAEKRALELQSILRK